MQRCIFFFDWDANFLLSEPKGIEEGLKSHHRHLIGTILLFVSRPDRDATLHNTVQEDRVLAVP